MTTALHRWTVFTVSLLLAAAIPLASHWWRGERTDRCDLDGAILDPRFTVRCRCVSGPHAFCSLHCAELWLVASGEEPELILVTDEVTGQNVDSGDAVYVRSPVVGHAASRERRHVFRSRRDAEQHIASFGGRILDKSQRPFATAKRSLGDGPRGSKPDGLPDDHSRRTPSP